MRKLFPTVLLFSATSVTASPPPPPPAWVAAAGDILAAPARGDEAKVAPLFSDDVVVTQNGEVVATGKAAWLAWRAKEMGYQRRTIGISEGWSRGDKGGGDLMVIDGFEDFDRSTLPSTYLVDSRRLTRSTLYRFARADHLIHVVEVSRVESFLMMPR